jgi:hypothetical protein
MSCTTLARSACFATLALVITVACASTSTGSDALRYERAAVSRHPDETGGQTRMLILTDSELATTGALTTTDAIRRLRPQFLAGSTRQLSSGPPEVAVYLNGMYNGELSTLITIPLSEVRRIVFMHPTEARSNYGLMCRCANGALLVSTRATVSP